MLIGYARVSTIDQTSDLQLDDLNNYGCDRIFKEQASGAKKDRPVLREALDFIRPGDSLVIWRLDRLGRSLSHLIEIIDDLANKEIGFISLQEKFDTTSSQGRLFLQIAGAFAEYERGLLWERTMAGLAAARARGRLGGRLGCSL